MSIINSKSNFFKFLPEDFNDLWLSDTERKLVATISNRVLTEWIELRGSTVYGNYYPTDGINCEKFIMSSEYVLTDTHQAVLINIKEIEKPKCEHEPKKELSQYSDNYCFEPVCVKCGVKLKARWEAVEP